MFETDLPTLAVTQLVDDAIDNVGSSPRRWAIVLVVLLIGALGMLWLTRRAVTSDATPAPDPGGPADVQRS